MIKIGSARIDEHGKIKGGSAGDQTGKEVCIENFYVDAKGWRCFRFKDAAKGERAAWNMEAACYNDCIGYDQSNNQSLFYEVQPAGWDCSKVKTPCETDCSQLMRVCILYAGINIGMFSTADEPEYLIKTGAFKEMTGEAYTVTGEKLRRSDILVTKRKGHTVMVLSDGAHAYDNKITVSGVWDSITTTALQIKLNTPADGIISKQYRLNKKYVPAAGSGWKWQLVGLGKGSEVIRALQKKIGVKIDGIVGKDTAKALQKYLTKQGYTCAVDGYIGIKTVTALQKWINGE